MIISNEIYILMISITAIVFTALALLLNIVGTDKSLAPKIWIIAVIFGAIISFDQLKSRIDGDKQNNTNNDFIEYQTKKVAEIQKIESSLVDQLSNIENRMKGDNDALNQQSALILSLKTDSAVIKESLLAAKKQMDLMPKLFGSLKQQNELGISITKCEEALRVYSKDLYQDCSDPKVREYYNHY